MEEVIAALEAAGWKRVMDYEGGASSWRQTLYPRAVLHLYPEPTPETGIVAHWKVYREPRRSYRTYRGLLRELRNLWWIERHS